MVCGHPSYGCLVPAGRDVEFRFDESDSVSSVRSCYGLSSLARKQIAKLSWLIDLQLFSRPQQPFVKTAVGAVCCEEVNLDDPEALAAKAVGSAQAG